jgi:hypothetical protein
MMASPSPDGFFLPRPDPATIFPSFEVNGENCKALTSQLFKQYLKQPEDNLPITVFLLTREGIRVIGLPLFSNDDEKSHLAAFTIPSLIRSSGARAVGWVSLCWYKLCEENEPIEQCRLSESPDRQEVLMLYLSDGDKAAFWKAGVRRSPDRQPLLTAWKREGYDDSCEFHGAFPTAINAALKRNLQENDQPG